MRVLWHVTNLFKKWFSIIKLLSLSEGDMTICSPSTVYIALGLHLRAILPASSEQTSLKGNKCIMLHFDPVFATSYKCGSMIFVCCEAALAREIIHNCNFMIKTSQVKLYTYFTMILTMILMLLRLYLTLACTDG